MHKKIIFFSMLSIFSPLISMQHAINEHNKEWTLITAAYPCIRQTLREICTALRDISSKNNLDLYACKYLKLNETQKTYALHLAQYKQKPEIIKNLCAHGATITTPFFLRSSTELSLYNTPEKFTRLQLPHYLVAAYFGDTDYLQRYCTNDEATISETMGTCSNTALHLAAKNGHLPAVATLLGHKTITTIINKPNNNYQTALWLAVYHNHYLIAQLLFKHPLTDLSLNDKKITTPLYIACYKGYENLVPLCIEKYPQWLDIYFKQYTPLYAATHNGNITIMRLLLTLRPEQINRAEEDDSTLLHLAAKNEKLQALALLLTTNAIDCNLCDSQKKTPLDYAIITKNQNIIELLRTHGAKTAQELPNLIDGKALLL